jgi:O-antigen/teichoic acid export membrane protein
MAMKDISQKMAAGAAWMVLFKLTERSIGLLSTLILARLLLPADFGLIAMAMSVIAILELLGSFGFDIVLIQKQRADRRHYDTAWTCNVMVGLGTAAILVALDRPAAIFFQEPRLEPVIAWLALGPCLQGFENIGVVAFRKDLQLDREFRFLLAKKVLGFAVTIPLAFILQNHWALVVGILTGRATGLAISYLVHPYRPRLSLAATHELFQFSKWLLLNNFLLFLNARSADLVVGKIAGPHSLGLYSIGSEISNLPTTELVAPINRAIFPGYAKMSGNPVVLRQGFLNVISVIAMFAIPASAGISTLSERLVRIALGTKWMAAVPLIQILAISGVLTALQTNSVYVYLALGRPDLLTAFAGATILILLPLLVWGTASAGILGAAWALVLTWAIILPVNFSILFRSLQLRFHEFFGVIWRPLVATAIMALAIRSIQPGTSLPTDIMRDIVSLGSSVIFGGLTYLVVLFGSWELASRPSGAEEFLVGKLTRALHAITGT